MGPTVLLEGACTSEQASSWCLKVVCVCVCVCVCACVGVGMGVGSILCIRVPPTLGVIMAFSHRETQGASS